MTTIDELFLQGHQRVRAIVWVPGAYIKLHRSGNGYAVCGTLYDPIERQMHEMAPLDFPSNGKFLVPLFAFEGCDFEPYEGEPVAYEEE